MKLNGLYPKRTRGFIILVVMCMCAASLIILAGILSYTFSTSNLNMRSNQLSLCQNAAEAATEKAYAKLAYDFEAAGLQTVSNNIANNSYRQLCPGTNESSFFGQFHFYDPSAPNASNDFVYVGYLTNYSGPLPTQYTNDYASSNSIIYRIVSNTTMPNSYANTVVGTAQEDVLLALVPINTYAIFYNGELEFSDCATMVVSGRTHSNADICTGAGSSASLTFNGMVTCSSVIQSPGRGGLTYSFNQNTTYNAGSSTDVVSVGISIPMANTHSIIQVQSPSVVSPASIAGQEMEYYDAQVVLLVTNPPNASSGPNPAVYLTLQTSYNQTIPGNDPSPFCFLITNATPGVLQTNVNQWNGSSNLTQNTISLPFLSLTNTFTDQREHQTNMYVTQIDVGAYADWVLTNSILTNKMVPSFGSFPLILYVADERNVGTNKLSVVRLANAARLPYNNNIGFSVATQNPLYVWGDYNITTNRGGSITNYSRAVGSTTNGFTIPSALMADAITVLSSNWNDSLSAGAYTSRTAANMTINAAIITGNIPSTGTSATTFSGGVHNLTRLLENWTGYNLVYNTSIVCLYSSQMATNQFQMPGAYYNPPNRYWGFDPTFYNPAREPPGIPTALVPIRFNWLQPPPGSITSGIN
jgi:hypothetical protein